MRMRTIEKGYAEMVAADPGLCLTKSAFRRMVVTGQIPSTKVGTKYLIDLDQVELYMTGRLQVVPPPVAAQNGIRRVV